MLVAFWQVQRLTREINELQKQAMDKQIELSNHQKYASALGASSIMNISNIAGLPSKLIPRASMFATYADQMSSWRAKEQLQMHKMMGLVPIVNGPMQVQIEHSAFRMFKEQAMKEFKQQEAATLNRLESEIQLELNQIEQRLKMKQAQLDSYKQLASKEATDCVPTFGLG